MAEYQKRKGYWKRKNDQLFSEIIKIKAGWKCQETGAKTGLQTAHVIPRNYMRLRWDFRNCICLKSGRHLFYTNHPIEWKRFINEKFGEGYYEGLEQEAMKPKKWALEELKELYEHLKDIRNSYNQRKGKFGNSGNPGRV